VYIFRVVFMLHVVPVYAIDKLVLNYGVLSERTTWPFSYELQWLSIQF